MIDIENAVYTKVYDALRKAFPTLYITADPVAIPSEYPCASIYEADNYSYDKTQDSASNENHVNVMYEVYVFSNKTAGRKTECKNIFNIADETLLATGFTRTSKTPILDSDGKNYRIVGRYTAVVSKDKEIYRR